MQWIWIYMFVNIWFCSIKSTANCKQLRSFTIALSIYRTAEWETHTHAIYWSQIRNMQSKNIFQRLLISQEKLNFGSSIKSKFRLENWIKSQIVCMCNVHGYLLWCMSTCSLIKSENRIRNQMISHFFGNWYELLCAMQRLKIESFFAYPISTIFQN